MVSDFLSEGDITSDNLEGPLVDKQISDLGITSSHPGINYNGHEEFVINPVYPGSSGSPIFLINEEFYKRSREYKNGRDKVRLLGIAYKHLYYTKKGKTISQTPQERSIKWDVILELGVAIAIELKN